LQLHGGLAGVSVGTMSRRVAHCLKFLSFSSIRLLSHLEKVFLEPWLAVVET
jgi:hypothetical protein